MTYNVYNWKENEQLVLFFQEHGWLFLWLLPSEHKANETKDNKNGTSLFAELKLLYANSVWITKNNVKANIWKLYMKFEANKEFMENLSLHTASALASAMIAHQMQSVQWLWSHACSRLYSNISRLVKKFEKYVNHLKKLKPMREKKCPCEWSTSTEFSYFSRKTSCSVPSERLLNFFGHLRIATKNPGTLRMKMSRL